MTLGEKIKQLRIEADLTQPELAVNAGIEQSYLSKLENDKAAPSFEVINKIAIALQITGMSLINSLDDGYVRERLNYIPEVAAKFAKDQLKQEIAVRRRYIKATLLIVFGICLALLGATSAIFSSTAYNYASDGEVHSSEPITLFSDSPLKGESKEAFQNRLKSLTSRLDQDFILSYNYQGRQFIEKYSDVRRLYEVKSNVNVDRPANAWLIVIGVGMIVLGGFVFSYQHSFQNYKKQNKVL